MRALEPREKKAVIALGVALGLTAVVLLYEFWPAGSAVWEVSADPASAGATNDVSTVTNVPQNASSSANPPLNGCLVLSRHGARFAENQRVAHNLQHRIERQQVEDVRGEEHRAEPFAGPYIRKDR